MAKLKHLLRQTVLLFVRILPQAVIRRLIHRDVISVFYHAVSSGPMPHLEYLYPPIGAEQFEHDLLYLSNNFNLISYEQLQESVMMGGGLPPLALHLSFDDGYIECYTVVRPLLLKYKIPCTFFITTAWIDNQAMFQRNKLSLCIARVRDMEKNGQDHFLNKFNHSFGKAIVSFEEFSKVVRGMVKSGEGPIDQICDISGLNVANVLEETPLYMTRGQIKQLHKDGFTLGSHTRSHVKLVNLNAEEMEEEIVESSKIIQEICGSTIVPFSFPNSATGIDPKLLNDIRNRHPFLGLFFDTKGVRKDVPFIINRIWAEKSEWYQPKITPDRLAPVIRSAYQVEMNNLILSKARLFRH